MAATQMYPSVLRLAANMPLVGNPVGPVPSTASKKWEIMTDIGAADLADPTLQGAFWMEVENPANPGVWVRGGGKGFVGGPYIEKDGTVIPGGKNTGFKVDAALYTGKNLRLVCECRTVPITDDNATVQANWQSYPFRNTVIGCTREAVG